MTSYAVTPTAQTDGVCTEQIFEMATPAPRQLPNHKANPGNAFIQQQAAGDLDLRRMMLNHEGSTSNSPLLEPVNFGHRQNDPAQSLSPRAVQTLKRSHWESVDKAKTCSEASCQRKFVRFDRRRNCCMCGKVFCRKCTQYRRKLSPDAQPDVNFGILCHVCRACFEKDTQEDSFVHDWTQHFQFFRQRKKQHHEALGEKFEDVPLHSTTTGPLKRDRIVSELQRLCIGFEANRGFMKSLVSDLFKIPSWQKSRHWVVSKKKLICQGCNETFKRMAQKVNCRVCGQVYCSSCTKEELMLYIPSGVTADTAKWCINGKQGGPEQPPRSFTLLPVCHWCCEELQAILLEKLNERHSLTASLCESEESNFMDVVQSLHHSLFKMKLVIDSTLPDFQNYVDSMDVGEGASRSMSPIGDLARATCELSDQFSQLAIESQKLRRLQPTTPTETKLLKHICIGTYQFYDDNMYLFRLTKKRLEELMPVETLVAVQQAINQKSLEVVHVLVKQICYEAIDFELHSKIPCDSVTDPLSKCVDTLEGELEELYTEQNQDWSKHAQAVSGFLKKEMSGPKRRLKLRKESKTPFRNVIVLHKMLQQCSNYLNTSLRELDAKTPMTAFPHSKGELGQLAKDFEQRVVQLSTQHPQVFQNNHR